MLYTFDKKYAMNLKFTFLLFSILFGLFACSQQADTKVTHEVPTPETNTKFKLTDFLSSNSDLDNAVNDVLKQLDDTAIIAQLIMPAVGKYGQTQATIEDHINHRIIGGVLMLNGTKSEFTSMISSFEQTNKSLGNLPFLYSADAEPSLVNRKIAGSTPVKKAAGINYNFAAVVDVAGNATVGYRGFGSKPEQLIPWSNTFIQETQNKNIIATAKHFPGHGLVSGDTHSSLQTIDGELKEISTYPELIKQGVLSIMVAHIAVINNKKYQTNGLPSTCSKSIVTDLLKNELEFNGLIVTDAMNMGGVVNVPQSASKAIEAGCHIVLMPVDAAKTHQELLARYKKDKEFKAQVIDAAKHVIRMKICLGLLN